MDKKREFNDALSSLVEIATQNGSVLSEDEVKATFKNIIDYEEMKTPIITYLKGQGITVSGISITSEDSDTTNTFATMSELEKNFVEMYKNDVKNIDTADITKHTELLKRHLDGENLLNELTEQNLTLVIDIANNFSQSSLTIGDLIQEGNIGLIEGIACYDGKAELEPFKNHLTNFITNAITAAIEEQNASSRIGNHLADRANSLDHASTELAKDLEREPTLDELSKYLSLDEDEVLRVMKMSLDALTIDDNSDE